MSLILNFLQYKFEALGLIFQNPGPKVNCSLWGLWSQCWVSRDKQEFSGQPASWASELQDPWETTWENTVRSNWGRHSVLFYGLLTHVYTSVHAHLYPCAYMWTHIDKRNSKMLLVLKLFKISQTHIPSWCFITDCFYFYFFFKEGTYCAVDAGLKLWFSCLWLLIAGIIINMSTSVPGLLTRIVLLLLLFFHLLLLFCIRSKRTWVHLLQ